MPNAVAVATSRPDEGMDDFPPVHLDEDCNEPDEEDFECVPGETGGAVQPRRRLGDPAKAEVEEHHPLLVSQLVPNMC